ncbi:hypothetical protein INT47_008582 [Mucor saturninus]|uniref:Uncharacterized protein n=1 Tax=Mucor saturninus TaxID=64648 RepID=A0A8H7RA88_9FUNG|nr:hypothetical protein INT47_008582 [Mucor saturninus]
MTPITSWHDRHSLDALNYLSYPLYFDASQKNLVINTLIQKIQWGCQVYFERNLSTKGQTVVLHTLLLSKLWQVLQQPEHLYRSFLRTSVLYHKYGLSLIESGCVSSYIWPLLSPTKRQGFRPLTTNLFTLLFSLMDSLSTYDLSQSDLSLATFLQLHLASIVIPASNTPVIPASESIISVIFPRNSASRSKILVRDFFIVDPNTHIIGQRFDRETRFPKLLRK